MLKYNRIFGKHDIKGLLGASRRSETYHNTMAFRLGFPSNEITDLSAGGTSSLTNSGVSTKSTLQSFFGRINYVYNEKFLFEADLRRDGSSKFAPGKQWGMFPAFSGGLDIDTGKIPERCKLAQFIEDTCFVGSIR